MVNEKKVFVDKSHVKLSPIKTCLRAGGVMRQSQAVIAVAIEYLKFIRIIMVEIQPGRSPRVVVYHSRDS